MVNLISNPKGSLSLICLLYIGVIALGGFGTWGILRHWRKKMEAQLQIDQCIGKYGLNLKMKLNELSASNTRLSEARAAALVAALTPTAKAALLVEIQSEFLYQEAQKELINSELLKSSLFYSCSDYSTRMNRVSFLNWTRLPSDDRGPNPFQWASDRPNLSFELLESHGVHSAIELSINRQPDASAQKNWEGMNHEITWRAQWASLH